MEDNGKVYFYNTSNSYLKLKVNSDSVDDVGAHSLDKTTKSTAWHPMAGDETVARGRDKGANRFGFGKNEIFIYRDVRANEDLKGLGVEAIKLEVEIDTRMQLDSDLVIYLFYDGSRYGYVLIDQDGDKIRSRI